ncbi:MAG: 30S ribosomal protein S18 [Kiritimatiellia bacterium]|nr:30S ribosomal protein S18 [Lentisphaerota bacterium]
MKRTKKPAKKPRSSFGFFAEEKRSRYLQGITQVDYKDHELLRKFMTEHGKVIPSRISGTSTKQQRQVKRAIRRARVVGLVR